MNRTALALIGCALLATAACSGSGGRAREAHHRLAAPGPASPPSPPDMSEAYRHSSTCDVLYEPVRRIIGWVGRPAGGRAAALVRILAIGKPRWNTPDGVRPTQTEADAMVAERDDGPSIFRPVTLSIERVLSGSASAGTIVALAESGTIGRDEVSSCAFGSPARLTIREGPAVATVGQRYVAILGNEPLTGRTDGPLDMPVIDDLFVVRGNRVVGLNEISEPLP